MKDAQTIFTIFYAIYFAVAVTLTGKFQPFDTPTMYAWKAVAWFRCLISFLLLDVVPLSYFVIVFRELGKIDSFSPSFFPMLALLMFSLAGFGFYRIYFGFMLIKYRGKYLFYGDRGLPETLTNDLKQRTESLSESHVDWDAHLVPGILWVLVCACWGYLGIICRD
jgi:hypothetical protein